MGRDGGVPFSWGLLKGSISSIDAPQFWKAQFLTKSVLRVEAEQFVSLKLLCKKYTVKVVFSFSSDTICNCIWYCSKGTISYRNLHLSNPSKYHTLPWTVSVALCPHKTTLHAVPMVYNVSFLLWTFSSHMKKLSCFLGVSHSLVLAPFFGPQLWQGTVLPSLGTHYEYGWISLQGLVLEGRDYIKTYLQDWSQHLACDWYTGYSFFYWCIFILHSDRINKVIFI